MGDRTLSAIAQYVRTGGPSSAIPPTPFEKWLWRACFTSKISRCPLAKYVMRRRYGHYPKDSSTRRTYTIRWPKRSGRETGRTRREAAGQSRRDSGLLHGRFTAAANAMGAKCKANADSEKLGGPPQRTNQAYRTGSTLLARFRVASGCSKRESKTEAIKQYQQVSAIPRMTSPRSSTPPSATT